jgi:hemolysin D
VSQVPPPPQQAPSVKHAPEKPAAAVSWKNEFLPDADELEKAAHPSRVSATLYLLLFMVVLAIGLSAVFEVDQVVTARGKLVTVQPNIVIQSFETAQITKLPIQTGQVVKKGQVLAVLDPTFVVADLAQAKERLSSLEAEARRIESELDGKTSLDEQKNRDEQLQASLKSERLANYQARLRRLDEGIERIKAAMTANQDDVRGLEERLKSLRELELMNEKLTEQQFQSNMKLLESRERRQQAEREMVASRNRGIELGKQLNEAKAEREAFTIEWRQNTTQSLVSVQRDRDVVAEQVKKAERRTRLIELKAPADAVVQQVVARSEGSIIREAEPLVTLVPLGEAMEAEVQIDAPDVGYVKVDDAVRVKIHAFPFQKHGLIKGKLLRMGQDAFSSENPQTVPYYQARVSLEQNELRNVPRNSPLIPGMTLNAEIMVGKRTVLSYVMYPVIRGVTEAAREP